MKYKLTDKQGRTKSNTQWGENVTHKASDGDMRLCSSTVIHCYDHPLLAVLLDPIHANFGEGNYLLWEGKGKGRSITDGLKRGYKEFTTIRQIEVPRVTMEQRIRFAIFCALEVYHDDGFWEWANNWLENNDRSEAAARAAGAAARAAARAAAGAAGAAAEAAGAARAAGAAAEAARAAGAVDLITLAEKAIEETI